MFKFFNLEYSETPGIVKVEILKTKGAMSTVKVIEIIRASTFRPCKTGQKLTVANRLLRDNL